MWSPAPLSVVLLLAGAPGALAAQRTTLDTLSLLRLPGVFVAVEPLAAEAGDAGLREDSLRAQIQTRLSDAGIPLLTQSEWQQTLGSPLLAVKVNLLRASPYLYLYNLELELKQMVSLMRDSTPAFATTWEAGDIVGSVQTANLPGLRHQVLIQVDRFIATYNAAQRIRRWW